MFFLDPAILAPIFELAAYEHKRKLELARASWSHLPEQEAKAAEAKWRLEQMERREQREHEMRVARESRSKNFWGSR